jgi:glycosyltransferase involved in cell wall biosynthesis
MIDFIVAVYNSEATIERCVRSISRIDTPKTISVIDNGSTDGTEKILEKIGSELKLNHYRTFIRSKAKAANLAYRMTNSPIICSVDSDVVYLEDKFKQLLSLLSDYDFLLLTDNTEDTHPSQVSLDYTFMPPRNSFLTTRRILEDRIFSPIYPSCGGEDLDLMFRLLKRGAKAARIYGGYEHLRQTFQMGYKRRIHFHVWNIITYLKHIDTQYCRQRLAYLASHPFTHFINSIRQEAGRNIDT